MKTHCKVLRHTRFTHMYMELFSGGGVWAQLAASCATDWCPIRQISARRLANICQILCLFRARSVQSKPPLCKSRPHFPLSAYVPAVARCFSSKSTLPNTLHIPPAIIYLETLHLLPPTFRSSLIWRSSVPLFLPSLPTPPLPPQTLIRFAR